MARLKLTVAGTAAVFALAALAATGLLAQQSFAQQSIAPGTPPQTSNAAKTAEPARPPASTPFDDSISDDHRAFEDYADAFDVFSDNSSQQRVPSAGGDDDRDARPDRDRRRERHHWRRHRHMSRMMQFCGPHADERANRRLDRMEHVTNPTDAQRPAFDKLKQAAAKALDMVRAACPAEPRPVTPPGRLAAAEKRLDAMLQAVRLVRPALDEFYSSLNDEQKARLYLAHRNPQRFGDRGERRFGRWRHRDDDRDEHSSRNNRRYEHSRRDDDRYQRSQSDDRSYDRRGDNDDDGQYSDRDDNDGHEHRNNQRDQDDWPRGWRGRS
jgi:hypothetical protein